MSMVMGRQKSPRHTPNKRWEVELSEQEGIETAEELYRYFEYEDWGRDDDAPFVDSRKKMKEETRRALEEDLDWWFDHDLGDRMDHRFMS